MSCRALALAIGVGFVPVDAQAQDNARPEFKCPRGEMRPLGRIYDSAGALASTPMGILAPFAIFGAFFDFLYSDDLAKLPKVKTSFSVKGADGKPIKDAVIALHHDGWRYLAQLPADGKPVDLPTGEYIVTAIANGQTISWGRRDIELKAGKPARIEVKAEHAFADAAPSTLARPASAGSVMRFDLLDGLMKRTTIAMMRDGKLLWQQEVGASPVRVIAPPEAGRYTMRVVACAPQVAVATWPFEVSAPNIALVAPQKVAAGSPFELRWTGNGAEGDLIGIRAKGQGAVLPGEVTYSGSRDQHFTFVAPFDAGEYEIVYRSSLGSTQLASLPLSVTPSALAIKAPQTLVAGESAEFLWPTGAGVKSDLTLWGSDESEQKPRATLTQPGANRLNVPPGRYRLMLRDGEKVRFSQDITIAPSRILESIPKTLTPNQVVSIPADKNLAFFDSFVLTSAGTRDAETHVIERVRESNGKVAFTAPALPGRYDIVYLAADRAIDKTELARASFVVPSPEGEDLRITAPKDMGALEEALLAWPDADKFKLEIWRKDAVRQTKPVRIVEKAGKTQLGLVPGTYELRLVPDGADGAAKPVLHRKALVVKAGKVLVDVPTQAERGKRLAFRVAGKPGFFDRVVIAVAGAKDPKNDHLDIRADATDSEIDAPKKPGRYELVYLARNDADNQTSVLDRVPFEVK